MINWVLKKWFWLVRNSAAAARLGWDAGGAQVASIQRGGGLKL